MVDHEMYLGGLRKWILNGTSKIETIQMTYHTNEWRFMIADVRNKHDIAQNDDDLLKPVLKN
jgi:hypothetical protein